MSEKKRKVRYFRLTTLEKRHVRTHNGNLVFRFQGKSGKEHEVEIDDPLAVAAVDTMRRRRGGGVPFVDPLVLVGGGGAGPLGEVGPLLSHG